jgi:hypothetical protein
MVAYWSHPITPQHCMHVAWCLWTTQFDHHHTITPGTSDGLLMVAGLLVRMGGKEHVNPPSLHARPLAGSC